MTKFKPKINNVKSTINNPLNPTQKSIKNKKNRISTPLSALGKKSNFKKIGNKPVNIYKLSQAIPTNKMKYMGYKQSGWRVVLIYTGKDKWGIDSDYATEKEATARANEINKFIGLPVDDETIY